MVRRTEAALWITAYVAVAVSPLFVALIDLEPGRGFVVNFSVALGFVGLTMLGLQFALVARFRRVAAPVGIDRLLEFHKQIAYVAVGLVLLHPILLFLKSDRFLRLLDVPDAPWRARGAVASTLALLALVALSVWRRRLRLNYEAWQFTHDVLAIFVVVAATAHALLVRYYLDERWEQAHAAAMSAAFVAIVLWVRLGRPINRRRHPWRVEAVTPEHGRCVSVTLAPITSKGAHSPPFRFAPGQFAWIMAEQSPFAVTQHPFSISSSAERTDAITLTIKAAGDFTEAVGRLRPGETVYLDGPFGEFREVPEETAGIVLIGGGVGVTPLMSILRTHADRDDRRPVWIFLANESEDSIIFREEIDGMCETLPVTAVHTLSHPPPGWEGEQGYLDAAMLRRHLPPNLAELRYFICGPPGLLDAAEAALAELGVPAQRVHSERFAMV